MDTLVEEEDVAERRCVALPPVILKRPEYEKALSSMVNEEPKISRHHASYLRLIIIIITALINKLQRVRGIRFKV